MGKKFSLDFKENSEISEENFEYFMAVVNRYAIAQTAFINKGQTSSVDFLSGIRVKELYKEVPDLKKSVEEVLIKCIKRLSVFPLVFSQGDFNPHNIFPKGVIDFDMGFEAPYGYDLVTAIYHTYAFPPKGIAEYSKGYIFSEDQEKRYLKMIDSVVTGVGLPKISDFLSDFLIGRLIWATVRMHSVPLLQKWRYDKFKTIIQKYLNNEDIICFYKS